jgi:hypothetical protein
MSRLPASPARLVAIAAEVKRSRFKMSDGLGSITLTPTIRQALAPGRFLLRLVLSNA